MFTGRLAQRAAGRSAEQAQGRGGTGWARRQGADEADVTT
jgi:hypothetical protein